MAVNKINLDVQMGTLPAISGKQSRQELANDIADRLIVRFPSSGSVFGIGSTVPTSNDGPYFESIVTDSINGNATQNNYRLLVWSDSAGAYVPIWLGQSQLRYAMGSTPPAPEDYLVWFQTDSNGRCLGIWTWDRGGAEWVNVVYNRSEIDQMWDGFDGVRGQVAWTNVTGRPDNIITAGNTNLGGTALVPAFDYQRLWHTGVGGEIIYAPDKGRWVTVSGVTGDLKFVDATLVGTFDDFNNGVFTTALGRNPGWVYDSSYGGNVLAAADPAKDWGNGSMMTAGSWWGVTTVTLTAAQSGLRAHNHKLWAWNSAGSDGTIDGFLRGSGEVAVAGELGTPQAYLDTNGAGTKLIEDNTPMDATQSHNNVQPTIAKWLLRKI